MMQLGRRGRLPGPHRLPSRQKSRRLHFLSVASFSGSRQVLPAALLGAIPRLPRRWRGGIPAPPVSLGSPPHPPPPPLRPKTPGTPGGKGPLLGAGMGPAIVGARALAEPVPLRRWALLPTATLSLFQSEQRARAELGHSHELVHISQLTHFWLFWVFFFCLIFALQHKRCCGRRALPGGEGPGVKEKPLGRLPDGLSASRIAPEGLLCCALLALSNRKRGREFTENAGSVRSARVSHVPCELLLSAVPEPVPVERGQRLLSILFVSILQAGGLTDRWVSFLHMYV